MLPITPRIKYGKSLKSATLREFSGGLNAIDDELNLEYKYATELYNCYPDSDGRIRVRYGYKLFMHCQSYFSSPAGIINMEYFNSALIVVGSNGEILRIYGNGEVARIWDTSIAAALPGAPSAWSATDFCSFAQFNSHLIICNGVDKPLDINTDFEVEYLQDAATNTNINTPICRYVTSCNRYLVMSGDPVEPDRVHISARDAHGTWFGDPEPNDATRVDVGSVLPASNTVRGICTFRDKLLVLFAEGLVIGQLGIYNDKNNHTPNFDDGIAEYGSISHRAAIAHGDDVLLMDLEGVPSIKRTILSASFKPERVSDLVDPLITARLSTLSFGSLEDRVFSVYDRKEGQFMLFIPNTDSKNTTTETRTFVFNYRPALKQDSWCEFGDWNFTCGCRSLQGNIFFADANGDIWLYGSRHNPVYGDKVNLVDLPITDASKSGNAVDFRWYMPWSDFRQPDRVKNNKYISFDTRGTGDFTCSAYADQIIYAPSLSSRFSGGDSGGYGNEDQNFGSGRNTSYRKKYSWPMKFEVLKLHFEGSTTEKLEFVSVKLQYLMGGNNR